MIYTRKREIKNPILIGKIYANWCFHCKQLIPEWTKMKEKLQSKPYTFIEIESEEHAKMANFKRKYKDIRVNGYPTIFARKGNRFEYYLGDRDADSLERWILSINDRKSINDRSVSDRNVNKKRAIHKKTKRPRGTQRRKRKLI